MNRQRVREAGFTLIELMVSMLVMLLVLMVTNGLLVDGHRMSSTQLRDGSQVRIGSTTLTVRVLEEG